MPFALDYSLYTGKYSTCIEHTIFHPLHHISCGDELFTGSLFNFKNETFFMLICKQVLKLVIVCMHLHTLQLKKNDDSRHHTLMFRTDLHDQLCYVLPARDAHYHHVYCRLRECMCFWSCSVVYILM